MIKAFSPHIWQLAYIVNYHQLAKSAISLSYNHSVLPRRQLNEDWCLCNVHSGISLHYRVLRVRYFPCRPSLIRVTLVEGLNWSSWKGTPAAFRTESGGWLWCGYSVWLNFHAVTLVDSHHHQPSFSSFIIFYCKYPGGQMMTHQFKYTEIMFYILVPGFERSKLCTDLLVHWRFGWLPSILPSKKPSSVEDGPIKITDRWTVIPSTLFYL